MKTFAQKEAIDYAFMEKVLKSIAPKHTAILKMLGDLQLSKNTQGNTSNSDRYDFVSYTEWKKMCFEALLVNKETELKHMLKELTDHRIIELRTDRSAGRDYVCIPTTRDKVREIVKKLKSK